jgi:hypothetical protein
MVSELPVLSLMAPITRYLTVLLVVTELASSAQLTSEAAGAWDQYISRKRTQLEDSVNSNKDSGVWVEESKERMRSVEGGVIVSEPVGKNGRVALSGALIHDWIGAVFVPHVTPLEVMQTLDQYDNYPEYYKPNVVRCRLLSRDNSRRFFSMTWQVRTAGVTAVIEADYETQYFVTASASEWWSFSRSTRVQQVDNYGHPVERLRPVGTGSGYLWNICSIMHVVQVGDGSMIQIETIALSRDVPSAIAWLANPIVSRISRNALRTTLQNTKEALAQSARPDTTAQVSSESLLSRSGQGK